MAEVQLIIFGYLSSKTTNNVLSFSYISFSYPFVIYQMSMYNVKLVTWSYKPTENNLLTLFHIALESILLSAQTIGLTVLMCEKQLYANTFTITTL